MYDEQSHPEFENEAGTGGESAVGGEFPWFGKTVGGGDSSETEGSVAAWVFFKGQESTCWKGNFLFPVACDSVAVVWKFCLSADFL